MTDAQAAAGPQRAALVIIGDEVLAGKCEESNFSYTSKMLRAIGVPLGRVIIIPDDLDQIGATVRECATAFDIVLTSGGVGPTHDDRTAAGVARAFDLDLVEHVGLRDWFMQSGKPNMTGLLRMARVPRDSEVLGLGTFNWVVRSRNVYMLPGVPKLFQARLNLLLARFRGAPNFEGRLYVRAYESSFADTLEAVALAFPQVRIGSYPALQAADYKVYLTVEADTADMAEQALRAVAALFSAEEVVRAQPPRPSGSDGPPADGAAPTPTAAA